MLLYKNISRYIITLLLLSIFSQSLFSWPGYRLLYKEQLYELYHLHLYMYPENYAENIHWLESVLKSDFANPLNALARIETKQEWEWYRKMFLMHTNLLLIKNYLRWAKGYMKEEAYFYNAPWRDMSIRSMKKSKALIAVAEVYWDNTLNIVTEIQEMKLYFLNLEEIQEWEDEYYRIVNNELNYQSIINRELQRIDRVTKEFELMDLSTY